MDVDQSRDNTAAAEINSSGARTDPRFNIFQLAAVLWAQVNRPQADYVPVNEKILTADQALEAKSRSHIFWRFPFARYPPFRRSLA